MKSIYSQFRGIMILVIILVLFSSNSLLPQNVFFIRNAGWGFGFNGSYSIGDKYDNNVSAGGNLSFTNLFRIESNKYGGGIKASVDYVAGLGEDLDPLSEKIRFRNYLQFEAGPTFWYHGDVESSTTCFSLLMGYYSAEFDKNLKLIESNMKESGFCISPSIEFKFWSSRSYAFNIGVFFDIPVSDYLQPSISLKLGWSLFSVTVLDSDEDGVSDDFDKCPNTRKGEKVDAFGCSKTQIDSDGDGLFDAYDKCPNTPSKTVEISNSYKKKGGYSIIDSIKYIIDKNGCGPEERDTDGDGIQDAYDNCPLTAPNEINLVIKNDPRWYGCGPSERDTDGDGVVDSKDKCPETPFTERKLVDSCGCSQYDLNKWKTDKDGDGFLDEFDEDVYRKEVFNFLDDDDGIPDTAEYLSVYRIDQDGSLFADSSANLLPQGETILKLGPLFLLTTYPKTYWVIETYSKYFPQQKAAAIKKFIDDSTKVPERTAIRYFKADNDSILLKLDVDKAVSIARNMKKTIDTSIINKKYGVSFGYEYPAETFSKEGNLTQYAYDVINQYGYFSETCELRENKKGILLNCFVPENSIKLFSSLREKYKNIDFIKSANTGTIKFEIDINKNPIKKIK